MDESMAPSNTPPCNAVYDGSNYYYLPWSSEKPCVCVESYWENIAFRLEPLNALIRIIDRLVSHLDKTAKWNFFCTWGNLNIPFFPIYKNGFISQNGLSAGSAGTYSTCGFGGRGGGGREGRRKRSLLLSSHHPCLVCSCDKGKYFSWISLNEQESFMVKGRLHLHNNRV